MIFPTKYAGDRYGPKSEGCLVWVAWLELGSNRFMAQNKRGALQYNPLRWGKEADLDKRHVSEIGQAVREVSRFIGEQT